MVAAGANQRLMWGQGAGWGPVTLDPASLMNAPPVENLH